MSIEDRGFSRVTNEKQSFVMRSEGRRERRREEEEMVANRVRYDIDNNGPAI